MRELKYFCNRTRKRLCAVLIRLLGCWPFVLAPPFVVWTRGRYYSEKERDEAIRTPDMDEEKETLRIITEIRKFKEGEAGEYSQRGPVSEAM